MFSFLKQGLAKVGSAIAGVVAKITDRPNAQTLEELEEVLLNADIGPTMTAALLKEVSSERLKGRTPSAAMKALLKERLAGIEKPLVLKDGLTTILIVGINGAGKTTSVAKLAHHFKTAGRKVVIGSADTFRAAANDQLATWAERADVPLIESRMGADPAAVAYDALAAAQARGHDLLLVDTAGRLHTKEKLMEELGKIQKAMSKLAPSAPEERWLVLDGSLGLNSLHQAQAFTQAVPLTGVIITKLDGSAKAGALIPIYEALKLPVYFVGLGEGIDSLKIFKLEDYIEALLS